jgi:hypothetical protein
MNLVGLMLSQRADATLQGMDKTLVPVRLPEPLVTEWRTLVLQGADRAKLRDSLVDRLPGSKPASVNSQLSRLLRGDGAEICGWLSPGDPRGEALCRILEQPREALEAWLRARLVGDAAPVQLTDLRLWPHQVLDGEGKPSDTAQPPSTPLALAIADAVRLPTDEASAGVLVTPDTEQLGEWLSRLEKAGKLKSSEQVHELLSPAISALRRLDGPSFVQLVSSAVRGTLSRVDLRSIRLERVEALLAGLTGDAAVLVRAVFPALATWLAEAGDWEAPVPAARAREILNSTGGREIAEQLLELVHEDDPIRRKTRAAELAGGQIDLLRMHGLILKAENGVQLSPRLAAIARLAAPLHALPTQASALALHPEGAQLVQAAVEVCEDSVGEWCTAGFEAVGLCQPALAAAVLEGLAARPEAPPDEAKPLWAAWTWMTFVGYLDHAPHQPGRATEEHQLAQRLSRWLWGSLPSDLTPSDLSALVPEPVLQSTERLRSSLAAAMTAPGDMTSHQALREYLTAEKIRDGSQAAFLLADLAPYQVPAASLGQWGLDHQAPAPMLERARGGDQSARQWLIDQTITFYHFDPFREIPTLCEWLEAGLTLTAEQAKRASWAASTAEDFLRLVAACPTVLSDEALIAMGFERASPPRGGVLHSFNGNRALRDADVGDLVQFAADLGRQDVLTAWTTPNEESVERACRHGVRKGDEVQFPFLEALAALRHRALLALGRPGERMEVTADTLAAQRRLARWCDQTEWALLRGGQLDTDERDLLVDVLLNHVSWSLTPRDFARTVPVQDAGHAAHLVVQHAVTRFLEGSSAGAAGLFVLDRLWLHRHDSRLDVGTAEADDARWVEQAASADQRALNAFLHGHSDLAERAVAHWSRTPDRYQDVELAARLWPHLGHDHRLHLLQHVSDGSAPRSWVRWARGATSAWNWESVARRHGTHADRVDAALRRVDEAEDDGLKMTVRVYSEVLPLDADFAPLLLRGLEHLMSTHDDGRRLAGRALTEALSRREGGWVGALEWSDLEPVVRRVLSEDEHANYALMRHLADHFGPRWQLPEDLVVHVPEHLRPPTVYVLQDIADGWADLHWVQLAERLGDRAIEFCELVVGTLERRSEDEVYAVLNVTVGPESASLDQRLVDAIATRPAHERPQFYAHLARLASYRLEGARAAALRQRVAQAWASHCD